MYNVYSSSHTHLIDVPEEKNGRKITFEEKYLNEIRYEFS